MKMIAALAARKIENWNTRVLGVPEARAFCAANSIYIVEDRRRKFGRLQFYKDYVFMLVNPKLQPGWRDWVFWHEIGHFLLHAPETSNFSAVMRRKNDAEANFIAAVALIPCSLVETATYGEIQDDFGYPAELLKIRKYIYDTEKI